MWIHSPGALMTDCKETMRKRIIITMRNGSGLVPINRAESQDGGFLGVKGPVLGIEIRIRIPNFNGTRKRVKEKREKQNTQKRGTKHGEIQAKFSKTGLYTRLL